MTPTPVAADPVIERWRRRREGAALLSRALDHCQSRAVLSEKQGHRRHHVDRCAHPEEKEQYGLGDVIGLVRDWPEVGRVIVEYLADQLGCDLVDRRQPVSAESDYRSLSDLAKSTGAVVASFASALADGHLTPTEAEQILFESRGAIQRLHGIVDRCKQAIQERGVRVRGAA